MKYANVTLGRVEAVWKQAGWRGGCLEKFLRDELVLTAPARKWREQDGVIYFSVTSDGTTGPEWLKRLKKGGYRVSDYAQSVLLSPDFRPTKRVTTEVAVLKGRLFEDRDRITEKIRAEAGRRGFTQPNAEIACLIREKFSDQELEAMGLCWIVAMHEPINDSYCDPFFLDVDRHGGGRWLRADYARPDDQWGRAYGFAFAAPQVSTQS